MREHNNGLFRTAWRCLALFALLLLYGCATRPEIKMRDNQDFSAIHTFYVQPPLNSLNQSIESHILAAITTGLQQKGLNPASQEDADIKISFFPSTENKEGGSSLSIGLGTGSYGRSGGISIGGIFSIPVGEQVTEYQNLQIDMMQNSSVIYSAVGSTKLAAADRITAQEALTKLVSELLEPYPVQR